MAAKRGRSITTFGQAFPSLSGGGISLAVAELVATFKGMFRGLFKRMR